ncbi:Fc.00g111510.m01.CDS01 [Cosmosporella sp. VM-42]
MSLYHEAADLLLPRSSEGGSFKSRVFRKKGLKSSPNQIYALALETCKWSPVLKEVIEKSDLLKLERKLTPTLASLLVHDLLLARRGIALPQSHGLRAGIERHKGRLTSELTLARLRRKAPTIESLKEQIERESAGEEANYPRWVRVNVVKSTLEDQLETTFSKFTRATSVQDVVCKSERLLYIDPHVPNLVAITPGIDLTKTEAYASGKIILQDKASCFPAYLLDPRSEDGDVIDACAAPGNKTTHLAGIIQEHRPEFETPPQTIFAFEKDSRRAQTLDKMVTIAGSKKTTLIGFGQDFLQVDPLSDKYKAVGALLLDPSCSGSGIVGRDSMPELHLPEVPGSTGKAPASKSSKRKRKQDEADIEPSKVIRDDDGNETVMRSEKDLEARLEALSGFQLTLLLHAFRFPSARKITYSTCSIHMQENERVVMRALQSEVAKERNWRILPRGEQVSGMREWPVRGLAEACGGDTEVADACIRSYKDDGQGVMGFFVAGFVRLGAQDTGLEDDNEGPYLRDDDGKIIRDALGMPVLRSTGALVALEARNEDDNEGENADEIEEEEDEDDDDSDESASSASDTEDSRQGTERNPKITDSSFDRDVGVATMDADEDEWQGIGD